MMKHNFPIRFRGLALLGMLCITCKPSILMAEESSVSPAAAPTQTQEESSSSVNPVLGSDGNIKGKPFSVITSLFTSTNLYAPQGETRPIQAELSIDPRYRISKKWATELHASIAANLNEDPSQNLAQYKYVQMQDGYARLAYSGWDLSPILHVSGSGVFAIPLSEASLKDNSLITATTLGSVLSLDLEPLTKIRDLSLMYMPQASRYFYQYTTSKTGTSLSEYALKHKLALGFSIINKLSFTTVYSRGYNYTYQGASTSSFGLVEDLSYSFTNKLSVSIGHQNGGNALKPNGEDSNITLVNERGSEIYMGATYVF